LPADRARQSFQTPAQWPIKCRRVPLQNATFVEGSWLFAEQPKKFVRQLGAVWKSW
jgi:hypothetical protein